ncbi:hypothetical protein [Aliikangiella sp. IMCC44632]
MLKIGSWFQRPSLTHQYGRRITGLVMLVVVAACDHKSANKSAANADVEKPSSEQINRLNTCTNIYPSYWQDPRFPAMWQGQTLSNVPPADWDGPIFKLSDNYPTQAIDDSAQQPWRASKFDVLFEPATSLEVKQELANEYAWLVYEYVLEGNVNRPDKVDWDICENAIRPWYHIPFQTYDAMSGREYTHGLTREAPVTFSVKGEAASKTSTMWAVGVYNATAAYTLGQVWKHNGKATIPQSSLSFNEGSVIAKPLFNTSSSQQLPVLANMPSWNANISEPTFCQCKAIAGGECSLIEESQQCPRSTNRWGPVSLLQFDIAIKDSRAPGTQWVYGTFVADGVRKAQVRNKWLRVSLLGLMWGNDTPPKGELAAHYPKNPKKNGFQEAVINWDTVAELNLYGGENPAQWMGHLGCNYRLNGPADNANSSCMSCHGTASVPDKNLATPPLLSQFSGGKITHECVTPDSQDPKVGKDRSGAPAKVVNDISFAALDGVYFYNTPAATAFNMMVQNGSGKKANLMGEGVPDYSPDSVKDWISLDYSLQLSISLKQWMQWQQHQKISPEQRVHSFEIERNHNQ